MATAAAIHQKAAEIGKLAVRMTTRGGSGHPSSSLSLAHIIAYLMYRKMRWDPANPWHPTADRLVLSEGHAVPIVYAALADLGAAVGKTPQEKRPLTEDDVDTLRARDSVLDGHPNPAEGVPFFDAATGSLGMGLSVACGLGLAARLDGSDRKIYCIIGDGESREGQVWEAVDFLIDHKLTNVCPIFNANDEGQADYVSPQQKSDALVRKLEAFGCHVIMIDGHSPDAIEGAFEHFGQTEKPLAIVARTVKGWGVESLRQGNWHGKPVSEDALDAAYASLDKAVEAFGSDGSLSKPPAAPKADDPQRPASAGAEWPSFEQAVKNAGLGGALEKGKFATRRAYGAALKAAGDVLPHVVALDGDVSNSTFANLFAKAHPERFFECKIAEQNMVSAGAGLAAAGFIPFVNSFAKFIARAYDQVEMANISRANLKIVGSHAGISLAADGPSQMGLLDVAFFTSFTGTRGDDRESPLCWFFHPSDAVAAYHCTRLMTELEGMCYMRTHRPDVPLLYAPDTDFEPRGFHVHGSGDDLAIVTGGYMVHIARQAIEELAKQNIRVTLVDAYCLPLDGAKLMETLQRAGGRVLVPEDNYAGGLSAVVASLAARAGNIRVAPLYCQCLPKSTRSPEEMLDYCGVGAKQIADHALALLKSPQ